MTSPKQIAITGAAGNIGYALAFRIAAGDMFGPDQPVILQLIEAFDGNLLALGDIHGYRHLSRG
mgnify:CR=1 FL=1